MNAAIILVGLALMLSLAMAGAWVIVDRGGKSGWIDAVWSFSIGAAGVIAALTPLGGTTPTTRQYIVGGLIAVWSLRLASHIARRTAKGRGDDPRYRQLKEEWGARHRLKLFIFLQIQAGAAIFLVLSLFAAAHNPAPDLRIGDWLGIAVLAIAIGGEGLADRQLAKFRADPKNKNRICDEGLWRLTRHPNYFFEWLGWIAYALIAISPTGGYPWGWFAVTGPIFMYWLLAHVSGIPPLEAHMSRSRGKAFADYQARVNAFWPGPPKS